MSARTQRIEVITRGERRRRHQFLANHADQTASFARVELLGEPRRRLAPSLPSRGLIEIVLPGGALVRVDAQVKEQALRRVLGVLRRAWPH